LSDCQKFKLFFIFNIITYKINPPLNANHNHLINPKKINCHSLINRITTRLTINNDTKTYVRVHL